MPTPPPIADFAATDNPVLPTYHDILNALIAGACEAEARFSLDELEEHTQQTRAEADARRDLEDQRKPS